ncbi:SAM-dependent methyltransferase [uncultured Zhongshania sp.]|uniref:class I SAM-dependent methyltransferase n=1 Tax=uncultured Zhongshania sp. TaxID=1642288 RepID=UPI0030DA1E7B|tara:strand:- start:7551 stop:8768 length:1218 start_codon:yes stop_codon:yes gene_type:complete
MSAANLPEQIQYFLDQYQQAFTDNTLQRVVLSKYQGDEADLNRVTIRPVLLKNALALSFLYEYQTRHVTKNLSLNESLALLTKELPEHYKNAHMVSETKEIQLRFSKKGKALINEHHVKGAKSGLAQPDLSQNRAHNREKHRFVKQDRPYLAALGVTDAQGQIIPAMSRKWKQINKFIEVLSGAIENTRLVERQEIHIADFGSGKAYLTFAVHDYLSDTLAVKPQVTGVELRQGLVDLCNQTAAKLALQGIKFEQGDVQHFAAQNINIMIALHACDTATDYAINMGIRSNADIIMCSPCCHKQIRPQLKSPSILAPLLQHGIHLGQEAEMLTDGLRALLLEAHGYDTQVFEFISLEHTNKNKMILAQKRKVPRDNHAILTQIAELKRFYGVKEHCLEELLNQQVG